MQKEAHCSPEPAVHDSCIAAQNTAYLLLYLLHHSCNLLHGRSLPTYCCSFSITHVIYYMADLYLLTVVSSPSLMQFATWLITTYLLALKCCIFSITHPVCYTADHYLATLNCCIFSITHPICYIADHHLPNLNGCIFSTTHPI